MNKFEKFCCVYFGVVIANQILKYISYKEQMKQLDAIDEMSKETGKILERIIKDSSKKLEEDTKDLYSRLRYQLIIEDKRTKAIIVDDKLFEKFGDALDYELELYNIYDPTKYYIYTKRIFLEAE